MFRPIRVDHTNCLQVAIKTHSFIHAGGTRPGQTRKKPKDLSAREREECGREEGASVYVLLVYHYKR